MKQKFKEVISLEELYNAYFDCLKRKRGCIRAIEFGINTTENLLKLYYEINTHTYDIDFSICFLVFKPKLREVFAANFRDRIIHHLLIQKTNHLFENHFIDNTFNCRKGKGTAYGINVLKECIRECSENYTKDCWIGKFDISGFFMSINKDLLWLMLYKFLSKEYDGKDKETLLWLFNLVIYNEPQNNCIKNTPYRFWKLLPSNKSLFTIKRGYGMAIGNLTSQILANFFLMLFDLFVCSLCKYYGRYVDDFFVVCKTKEEVIRLRDVICSYLELNLGLILHPNKIYIQHYTKGVRFTGGVVKKDKIYVGNCTVGNFVDRIRMFNNLPKNSQNASNFMKSINSYLGHMCHCDAYNVRKKCISKINKDWLEYFFIDKDYKKVIVKTEYNRRHIALRLIKKNKVEFYKEYLNIGGL